MNVKTDYNTMLNDLLSQIKSLGEDDRFEKVKYLNNDLVHRHYPLIHSLIENVFITERGNPNYSAIIHFENNGIKVGPGETDQFGWVTGCVHTAKGIIVF